MIGCPKTIDGDLKCKEVPISFGFDTACKVSEALPSLRMHLGANCIYGWHWKFPDTSGCLQKCQKIANFLAVIQIAYIINIPHSNHNFLKAYFALFYLLDGVYTLNTTIRNFFLCLYRSTLVLSLSNLLLSIEVLVINFLVYKSL